jgi:hypothetical protein
MSFCYTSCMAKFSCILLLHVYINILRVGFFLRKCLCTKIISHIKTNVCKFTFFQISRFVNLYLIQIHISEPIGTKLCTHLLSGLEKTIGYVCNPRYSGIPTFFYLFCREGPHDAAQKWLPSPRGIRQSVIFVHAARVRVTSRAGRRGALHMLTAHFISKDECMFVPYTNPHF